MFSSQQQSVTDSAAVYSFEDTAQAVVVRKPTTPREVLRLLPADATPAQQDSAIQAMLDIPPAVISSRPDTLNLPGLEGSPAKVDLSRYSYKDNFFSGSEFFHPELRVTQIGMAAEPMPYRLRDDDFVTGALLVSFFLVALFIVRSSHILLEKIKGFFYVRGNDDNMPAVNTDSELRNQALLVIHTSFVIAILFFDYTQQALTHVFNSVSPYILLGTDAGICLLYFAAKMLAYHFVNWVFFEKRQRRKWMESYVLTVMMTGLASFPLVLLLVYFDLPFRVAGTAFIIIAGLSKLLLFVKCKQIFFNLTYSIFHLFLYFCTLELIPMLLLWRILVYCNEILVVNI